MFVAPEDYEDRRLHLDERLIRHPAATFFLSAIEDSPQTGVRRDDLLIVDRAERATPRRVVIAPEDGELRIRRLPASWRPDTNLEIWGVVLWIVRAP